MLRNKTTLLSLGDTGEREQLYNCSKDELINVIDALLQELQRVSVGTLQVSLTDRITCDSCGCTPCAGQSSRCAPHGRG